MMFLPRSLVLLIAATSCTAQIRDDAELFKPETKQAAEKRIKQIRETTGKQIAVWTMKGVPADRTKDINLGDAGQRKKLFDEMAREQIKALHLEGIHLLICEEPRHIEITVTDDCEPLFGEWYQRHLKKRMIGKFQPDNPDQNIFQSLRNKLRTGSNPDEGLSEALDYIALKFDYNRPIDNTNFKLGGVAICGFLGFGAILGVMRSRLRTTTPHDAGVHDAESSGRSIAVLGGGIGAVTGQWMFNALFGMRSEEEHPITEPPPPTGSEPAPDAEPGEV